MEVRAYLIDYDLLNANCYDPSFRDVLHDDLAIRDFRDFHDGLDLLNVHLLDDLDDLPNFRDFHSALVTPHGSLPYSRVHYVRFYLTNFLNVDLYYPNHDLTNVLHVVVIHVIHVIHDYLNEVDHVDHVVLDVLVLHDDQYLLNFHDHYVIHDVIRDVNYLPLYVLELPFLLNAIDCDPNYPNDLSVDLSDLNYVLHDVLNDVLNDVLHDALNDFINVLLNFPNFHDFNALEHFLILAHDALLIYVNYHYFHVAYCDHLHVIYFLATLNEFLNYVNFIHYVHYCATHSHDYLI